MTPRLRETLRCPDCRQRLAFADALVSCTGCGRTFDRSRGYLDLRPVDQFAEQTRYLDDALHADARHETISPPLLQAGVRQWMLRRFLRPASRDLVVDLGCGNGRSLVWNAPSGAEIAGVDVSPYFATEAVAGGTLVLGDLRRLPFDDVSFDKAYALDVFEHLSRDALDAVLLEVSRVLRPGGELFAYSHVRRNSALAFGLRAINRLARGLERVGLIDLRRERLRKSDHVNPLASIPDLERAARTAGFTIYRIRYYTPLVGAFVENILLRVAERLLGRRLRRQAAGRAAATAPAGDAGGVGDEAALDEEARLARSAAKARIAARGPLFRALQAVTVLMRADVWLFGRVRSGPFFALLVKDVPPGSARWWTH